MHLHLVRSETRHWIVLRRYRLAARIDASAEEISAIRRHRIDRCQLFVDPRRQDFFARAEAANERAAAVSHWVETPEQMLKAVAQTWGHSLSAMTLYARTLLAFRLTVGNLVDGAVVEAPTLAAIIEIENAISACVDALDAAVSAALAYQHGSEDVLAPGEPDTGTPPSRWLRGGRAW